MNTPSTTTPPAGGKRRMLRRMGLAALALAALLAAAAGLWPGHDLGLYALVCLLLGAAWLLCSFLVSDEPLRAAGRRYLREFVPTMVAYVLLLPVCVLALKQVQAVPLRVVLVLLPVVPVALLMRAMLRLLLGSDELERLQQLQAIAIAAMSVGLLSCAAAFLAGAGLLPIRNPLMWVLPAMLGAYGLVMAWLRHRYRD